MLKHLSIRNIVLIEQCELSFGAGLCVLTGETGAGKSILLESLGLVLGSRADTRLLRAGEAQGNVAAEFDISANDAARALLQESELPVEDALLLRRSITADGKTRCFINDVAVSVTTLKKLGETLVQIHGQHDQRGLFEPAVQRDLLDDYAALAAPRRQVAVRFAEWKEVSAALEALQREIEAAAKEEEYLRFLEKELSQCQPEEGEEERLATQRTQMMQGEKLAVMLSDALAELDEPRGVDMALRSAQRVLARSSLVSMEALGAAIETLERAAIETEEARAQIERLQHQCEYNPAKLEKIEERLFALKALARKYQTNVDGLPGLLSAVQGKLAALDTGQKESAGLMLRVKEARELYVKAAETLSQARAKAAKKLEKTVLTELKPLKMEATQFRVHQEPLPESAWGAHGMDAVQFEVATNHGSAFGPLGKIASGGELSRFMLALKVAMAGSESAMSYIFDEIDTGTGGAVADAIGQRLAMLGKSNQVLVVTHLPQVAARGDQHLKISKQSLRGKTMTSVEALGGEARREELARMLAGAEITREARDAAGKLLEMAV